MDKKWCSSCQTEKPASNLKLVASGNRLRPVMRWKCESCLNKSSKSKYSKKEK